MDELICNRPTSSLSAPGFADDVGRSHNDGTVVGRLLKVTHQGQHRTGATSDVYDCGRGACV